MTLEIDQNQSWWNIQALSARWFACHPNEVSLKQLWTSSIDLSGEMKSLYNVLVNSFSIQLSTAGVGKPIKKEIFMNRGLKSGVVLGVLAAIVLGATGAERPPNVVIFLADDLGYGDLGYTGSTLAETPNIDAFAKQGMVFTSGYAPASHCSPSRAAILTGQYPARLHITTWIGGKKDTEYENMRIPEQKKFLAEEAYTLAEYFKSRGYATLQVGKWHVGGQQVSLRKHGFDEVAGWSPGAGPGPAKAWFGPYPKIKDLTGPADEYITDRLTDEAIKLMKQYEEKPFFLMLQHYDVHAPLVSPEKVIQKYVDKGQPLDQGRENATFLAMKEKLDDSFGRINTALTELGLADNTIVIFFSDNGGVPYFARNAPCRAGKKSLYEGGIRVPLVMRVPGMTQPGSSSDVAVNGIDFFPTLVELTGGDPSKVDTTFDGTSLVPLLKGGDALSRKALFWHSPQKGKEGQIIPPQGAVRMGKWKLVHYYGGQLDPELYNLDEDISENRNVAASHPEVVENMRKLLIKHLDEVDAQQVEIIR